VAEVRLSGSTIKSWFQYRCDRKTRYESLRSEDRDRIPVTKVELPSEWAEFGNDFERRLVSELAKSESVFRPFPGETCLSQKQSESFISGRTPHQYAYQFVMEETPQLRALLRLPDSVRVNRSIADLLRVLRTDSGEFEFTVIDIKASQVPTIFHRAQVAFYALMLSAWIKNLGLHAHVSEVGEIWHLMPGSDSVSTGVNKDPFPLRAYEHLVLDFFQNRLREIISQRVGPGIDETFFHIYFKCEQCEYVEHCCRSIAIEKKASDRDVSAVPGMSHEGKRALRRWNIVTVGQLASATALRRASGMPWSVRAKADKLSSRAMALVNGATTVLPDRASYLMPPRIDVGFYLVADHDPVAGRLVTLGYMRIRGSEAKHHIRVAENGSSEAELSLILDVLRELLTDLSEVDAHNRASRQPLYAHIFVYEPSESQNLQEAIGRHLDSTEVRAGLLQLIRIFPPEEVLPEPEYKGYHHLPATAVRTVLEQLVALPTMVAYDLRQVSGALANAVPALKLKYQPEPDFQLRFSSRLAMQVCRKLRAGTIESSRIVADVKHRLETTASIVEWLLDRNREAPKPFLRLAKKPFQFQQTFDPLTPSDLDVLQAQELLESRSVLMQTLVELALPWEERTARLRCLPNMKLEHVFQQGRSRVLLFQTPAEAAGADLDVGEMGLILTDDDPDIRLNPAAWSAHEVSLLASSDSANQIRIQVWGSIFDAPPFQRLLAKRGRWFLDKAFKDVNSTRVIQYLGFLAQR